MRYTVGIACWAAALVLGAAGWLLPAYLDAVAPSALHALGQGTPSVAQAAELRLAEGQYGPAWRLTQCAEQVPGAADDLLAPAMGPTLTTYIDAHPGDALTGGGGPYLQQFAQLAPKPPPPLPGDKPLPFNAWLAERKNRDALRGLLAGTRNQNVRDLLATRELTGLRQFMPVSSAAGAPLDSAIVTTALLVQSGHIGPEFARELAATARLAMTGDTGAIARMEAFYLSALGAAQRLDGASLGQWARLANDPLTFLRATTLLRQSGERQPLVFAVATLSERPDWLADYAARFGEKAWPDLACALAEGQGAVIYLLEKQLPIYAGAGLGERQQAAPENPLARRAPGVAAFCARQRALALTAKATLLLLAGVFVAAGAKALLTHPDPGERPAPALRLLQDGAAGVLALVAVVAWQEPQLFAQPVSEPGALFLEFELPLAQSTITSDTMPDAAIDQQTILVLLIFFMVQLVIYVVCLLKLSTLKRAPVPPETRLSLLENEEPLFDLGLYVGLAGTVISLLMLAMGVVQASLVAAYASTLFGILFVALLKILHVRPLKRQFILERQRIAG